MSVSIGPGVVFWEKAYLAALLRGETTDGASLIADRAREEWDKRWMKLFDR